MSDTFQMNRNHRDDCPCFSCLKKGDKVLVYVSESGGFSEEIETKILYIHYRGEHPIGVLWPHMDGQWRVSANPNYPKASCDNTGKVIRKVIE